MLLIAGVDKVLKRLFVNPNTFQIHTEYDRKIIHYLKKMNLVSIDKRPIKTRVRKRQFKYSLTADGIQLYTMVLKAERRLK